ncbi:MAG: 30S ribosomal protein S18 [Dehalococcoidia bacterium]|nr:30S ribosomal protein S18 [Dehalococcoidia bacterium]
MAYGRKASASKRPGRSPRYVPRRKVCIFCAEKTVVSYKAPESLRRYLSDRGKIDPRRRSGNCAKHQRALAQAIKRARHLALLPYCAEHIHLMGGVGSRG